MFSVDSGDQTLRDADAFGSALTAIAEAGDPAEYCAAVYRAYRRHKQSVGDAILGGAIPTRDAGLAYTALADCAVQFLTGLCERDFVARHGRVRGGQHALVALGKLGSRELTAGSDLDLMLLYDFDESAPVSDGPQPLVGCQYYGRLAQRLIAALTCSFGDGRLFEVDFRLRPWGSKGPIATHLQTLRGYFASEAWTFEAMALTRARVVTGSAAFAPDVDTAVRRAIQATAARRDVRSDVATMRKLVQREKASRRVWDIKCVAGGMMDVDFVVQCLALEHMDAFDGRPMNDTDAVIAGLDEVGALSRADATALHDANALYRTATQILRTADIADPRRMPAEIAAVLAHATGSRNIKALEERLREAQRRVRAIFEDMMTARQPAWTKRQAA